MVQKIFPITDESLLPVQIDDERVQVMQLLLLSLRRSLAL